MMVHLKPNVGDNVAVRVTKFQFHDGTIKTSMVSDSYCINAYFNSMMVQLKLISTVKTSIKRPQFQFHDGTIKTNR